MDDWSPIVTDLSNEGSFRLSAEMASSRSAGSWTDSEVGPSLYQRNVWRMSPTFNTPATPPSGALITYLSWQWSITNYPYGLLVYICDTNYQRCGDVSSFGSGATDFFNDMPASTNFLMAFGVPGSGTIIPIARGQNDTINVSWSTD